MINTVIIRGRLGNDVKILKTKSEKAYARLSVAVSDSWKDKQGEWQERVNWIPVVTFQEGLVEKVLKDKAKKGADVIIEGELSSFDYKDQNNNRRAGIEVTIGRKGSIVFLPSGTGGKAAGEKEAPSGEPPAFEIEDAHAEHFGEGAGR